MEPVKYYPNRGYIGGENWLLYDSDSIKHLSPQARLRLAELTNEHDEDEKFDYLAAREILIAEGLYTLKDNQ